MTGAMHPAVLGLAAEYAVASELCRHGIYAQLTFGNQKRTDILVFANSGKVARIEVKAKQGPVWPNCKGIADKRAFLVFVDYQDHQPPAPPEFYVLSERDWRRVLEKCVADLRARNPKKRVRLTPENTCEFVDQIGPNGKPYVGMSIRPVDLQRYRSRWGTITKRIGVG